MRGPWASVEGTPRIPASRRASVLANLSRPVKRRVDSQAMLALNFRVRTPAWSTAATMAGSYPWSVSRCIPSGPE